MVSIYSDNRDCTGYHRPFPQAARTFLRRIHNMLKAMPNPAEVQWVPAHVGIKGNERADELAKRATGWRAPPLEEPVNLPMELHSHGSTLRAAATKAMDDWIKNWKRSPHGAYLRWLQPTPVGHKAPGEIRQHNHKDAWHGHTPDAHR